MYNVSFPKLGLEFTIDPIAFSVGNFKVYWYGIIIGTGLILAIIYAYIFADRYRVDRDKMFDSVLVGIVGAVVGARLYYVLFKWDYYGQHLNELFNIKGGGLAIYGGIIGAILCGGLICVLKKQNLLALLDVAMIGFLIGQGLGRWGNFMNQEAFGVPTDLPWGMVSERTAGVAVHPCFLYESIWCLLGAVLFHFFAKKHQKYSGQVFFMYLVWYGFERMLIEGLRTDSLYLPFSVFGIQPRVSQILSAVIMIAGIVCLIIFSKRKIGFAEFKATRPKKLNKNIVRESVSDGTNN